LVENFDLHLALKLHIVILHCNVATGSSSRYGQLYSALGFSEQFVHWIIPIKTQDSSICTINPSHLQPHSAGLLQPTGRKGGHGWKGLILYI
jgi:hypothetical protein